MPAGIVRRWTIDGGRLSSLSTELYASLAWNCGQRRAVVYKYSNKCPAGPGLGLGVRGLPCMHLGTELLSSPTLAFGPYTM